MSRQLQLPTLVELNSSNVSKKVFCLHTGGGGVNFYSGIAGRLADIAHFYGLEEPSIYDSFEYSSIPELAEYHVDVIKELQEEGPYVLFGYCSGGPIAFEVASQLALDGHQIDRVVLFGSALDKVMMGLIEVKDNYRFLKNYLSHKYDINLDGLHWESLEKQSLDAFVQAIVENLISQNINGVLEQQDWITRVIKSLYFFHNAAKKYRPSKSIFDIDVFERYLNDEQKLATLPWCDWSSIAKKNITFFPAPLFCGGHNDILKNPYLENTEAQLRKLFHCLGWVND